MYQRATNSNPTFAAPAHHKARPFFIRRAQKFAGDKDLALWPGWVPLLARTRKRRLYPDAANALNAIVPAMLHYANLCTHHVHATVEQLSDDSGLSTTSASGNKSITRACRIIQTMESVGLVHCPHKIWDKHSGTWLPKYIELTDVFWTMIGMDLNRVEQEQHKWRAKTEQALIPHEDAGKYTFNQLKELSRVAQVKKSYEKRYKKSRLAKSKRLAKQIETDIQNNTHYSDSKRQLMLQAYDSIPANLQDHITISQLESLANKRGAYLRKVHSPPEQATLV